MTTTDLPENSVLVKENSQHQQSDDKKQNPFSLPIPPETEVPNDNDNVNKEGVIAIPPKPINNAFKKDEIQAIFQSLHEEMLLLQN